MDVDLVFEGGGAKGIVFVGAMQAFEERHLTPRRLVGTSAGAITAALLAAGYDAERMRKALEEEENGVPVFATFLDPPEREDFEDPDIEQSLTMKLLQAVDLPFIPGRLENKADRRLIDSLMKLPAYRTLFSFVERGGLYAGNAFLDWMGRKLDEIEAGLSDMTLAQLHAWGGHDLSLVASDTTDRTMLVLNHRTAPNCPVLWAVRMSMSIPFAWHEVRWDEHWDPYVFTDLSSDQAEVEPRSLAGHAIVDGGALSNFPINLLTTTTPAVRAVMGEPPAGPAATVGLLIDESRKVEGAPPPAQGDGHDAIEDVKKLRTVERVSRLINTMMAAHNSEQIRTYDELICRLPAKTYGTMEFDMSDARRGALVAAGKRAMAEHLEGRDLGTA
jgi:NTE family protein